MQCCYGTCCHSLPVRLTKTLLVFDLSDDNSTPDACQEFEQAQGYYARSLVEHRTPETKAMLAEVQQIVKQRLEDAYRDPLKADEERDRGDEFHRVGGCSTVRTPTGTP